MGKASKPEALKEKIVVVAGMPRSGTTFLYHQLDRHPSIFVPFIKETDYFSVNYDLGSRWYLGLFQEMLAQQLGFDISPSYFVVPSVVDRIMKFNSKMRVVLAIRDPAEFACSLYCQLRNATWRMPPFEEFIELHVGKLGPSPVRLELRKNTVRGKLEEFRKVFGDNLLFYTYDRFRKRPLSVLQAIESFVGVPRYFTEETFENVVINAADRKNVKLLGYLMSQLKRRGRLAFITNASIRETLRSVRKASDLMSNKDSPDSRIGRYPPECMRIAAEVFADQRAAIEELFSGADMQLGSGTPFP